jgi:serine/threonine-protein kinase
MSVVWRAQDQVLGRAVAVKVLAGRYADEQVFRTAIQREAKAAARLSHPHVANVYDYGESLDADGEPVPFVVMELLAGRSLADRIAESSMLPRVALRVCAQVAGALAAAHANDLVHRDVKPGNIMLTAAGAKVFDFGISAVAGAPDQADESGRIFGTLAYMAPERLVSGAVLAASDVYALGLLLCRLLTDRLPAWAGDPVAFLALPVPPQIEPLPEIEGVPEEVSELYQRCVARDPAQRPTAREAALVLAAAAGIRAPLGESSADLEDDSTNLTHDREKAATTVATVRDRGRHWKRAAIGLGVLVVGAGVVAGLAGAFRGTQPTQGESPAVDSVAVPVTSATPGATTTSPTATPTGTPRSTGTRLTSTGPSASAVPPATGGPSSTPEPTTPPPPAGVTLASDVGSIVVTCDGTVAQLLSVTPNDGFVEKRRVSGPAAKVRAVFKQKPGPRMLAMIVTCVNDTPHLETKDNDDGG